MKEYTTQRNFQFIKAKINEIRSALFSFTDIDDVNYPTCIVSALRVDEDGGVWFLMNRNGYKLVGETTNYPAKLSFYRKGFPFTLNVSGKAEITRNPEKINQVIGMPASGSPLDTNEIMLVKMQMSKATYFEWTGERPASSVRKFYHNFLRWLHSSFTPMERQLEYQFQ